MSSRALPPSPVTTPIVRGSAGRAQRLLRREQPLGVERLAQPVELREQVALAGDAQAATRNENDGDDVRLPA